MLKKFLLAAGIALAVLVPTNVSNAVGDDAVVTVEILVNGDIEVTSTKELSNVHIAVCVEGEVVVTKFDSLNDTVEVFDVDGNLIAVLAHSGENTSAEAEALLTLLGGTVSGNSTGTIVFFDEDELTDCGAEEEEPVLVCVDDVVVELTVEEAEELELDVLVDVEVGDDCGEETIITTTTTTTTTAPPPPPILTVTPPPPVVTTTPPTPPVAAPAPVTAPAPVEQLPRTGSGVLLLSGLGLSLTALGSVLRRFKK